jgi:hypothetical protein
MSKVESRYSMPKWFLKIKIKLVLHRDLRKGLCPTSGLAGETECREIGGAQSRSASAAGGGRRCRRHLRSPRTCRLWPNQTHGGHRRRPGQKPLLKISQHTSDSHIVSSIPGSAIVCPELPLHRSPCKRAGRISVSGPKKSGMRSCKSHHNSSSSRSPCCAYMFF